eukprot:TRINITY_DN8140_c0_g4_i3.p1 TRINITY_DN8140_c0_g4~~TRINITY_DN8140_c0_g4_i3.p1  ORF type:complete len:116 (-),score=5.07 TRINITY_DN8140_c0_g4_i3:737-1084(-)
MLLQFQLMDKCRIGQLTLLTCWPMDGLVQDYIRKGYKTNHTRRGSLPLVARLLWPLWLLCVGQREGISRTVGFSAIAWLRPAGGRIELVSCEIGASTQDKFKEATSGTLTTLQWC